MSGWFIISQVVNGAVIYVKETMDLETCKNHSFKIFILNHFHFSITHTSTSVLHHVWCIKDWMHYQLIKWSLFHKCFATFDQGRNYRGGLGGCLTPPIFCHDTLVGQKSKKVGQNFEKFHQGAVKCLSILWR